MSIEQTDAVDFIGTDRSTGAIVLTISDHLSWLGADDHYCALEKKIGAYIRFIKSGDLASSHPESNKSEIVIRLVCKHCPTEKARLFLDAAARQLKEIGLGFSCEVLPEKAPGT